MTIAQPVITRPATDEYGTYYHNYIQSVPSDDLLQELQDSLNRTREFFLSVPQHKLDYAYTPGKWTVKDLLVHLIDAERIFAYRALRFARRDKTELPSFDENTYVTYARAGERSIRDILDEWQAVRMASITLFKTFDEETFMQKGIASKNPLSVRALGYIIIGHELHHIKVIKERYL